MKINDYISESHERCRHLQSDKIDYVIGQLNMDKLETELIKAVSDCLSENKTIFFALYNSFFTVTNKELAVLNCFVNKNSNIKIKTNVCGKGIVLREDVFGTNATALSALKDDVAYVLGKEHYRQQSKKLSCVAAPIRVEYQTIGYICFSTINKMEINGLRAFIESLSLNITSALIINRLKNKLLEQIRLCGINLNDKKKEPDFSQREKQIIEHVMKSCSQDVIASELGISEKTVWTYQQRIFEKCGTTNRFDTAIYLLCNEILHTTGLSI